MAPSRNTGRRALAAVGLATLGVVVATTALAEETRHRPGLLHRLLQRRATARGERTDDARSADGARLAADAGHAGFRVVTFAKDRRAAVWYPTSADEAPFTYANGVSSTVAVDAAPAAGRAPLVLFSHGFGGCSLQSLFLTETLARHGYVVAAPDHADARCGGARSGASGLARPEAPFRDPDQWTEWTYADRAADLAALLRTVLSDSVLGSAIDDARLAVAGHSLGGYTAMGVAGGWPAWTLPHVRAALLLSPYVAPFVAHDRVAAVHVPVMYQGGTRDVGITPGLRRPGGAYDRSAPPKCYVELEGVGHFGWTNLACRGKSVRACVAGGGTATLVDRYALAFLDRYLADRREPSALDATASGVTARRCAE